MFTNQSILEEES